MEGKLDFMMKIIHPIFVYS